MALTDPAGADAQTAGFKVRGKVQAGLYQDIHGWGKICGPRRICAVKNGLLTITYFGEERNIYVQNTAGHGILEATVQMTVPPKKGYFMAKKNARNTRGKIVSAAWKLFYEQGYEDTTVEEIIELSKTSKGSFYHYFDGKDALLSTLSTLFDEKYERLMEELDPALPAMETLLFLNSELFGMIENSISIDLLTRLFSTQLITSGEKHLLDHNRTYYKLLRKIIAQGQAAGQLSTRSGVSEMVKLYALCERALLYDWCLCGGEYSLRQYSSQVMPSFLSSFLP